MALTTHISQTDKTQSPYKLDTDQTLRASQALLRHVQAEVKRIQEDTQKVNLLANNDSDEDGEDDEDAQPIWLNLATKAYITDKARLKPSKIPVPHSLNKSENSTICIITTDPQRALKNVVADIPAPLSGRITRIIGLSKLAARYKSFEQRRQLLSEHDIFLADDRIVGRLPKTLGKVFYKGTAKRPIPIDITPRSDSKEKSAKKLPKDERQAEVASAEVVAKEIEKALSCVPVSLSPGYNIAVRVGLATFTPEQIRDNVVAVTNAVVAKHVVSGWRNVKSVHVKTSTSMAVPIWLADDLQLGSEESKSVGNGDSIEQDNSITTADKKRKRDPVTTQLSQTGERKKARQAEQRLRDKQETASRKARLSTQKTALLTAEA